MCVSVRVVFVSHFGHCSLILAWTATDTCLRCLSTLHLILFQHDTIIYSQAITGNEFVSLPRWSCSFHVQRTRGRYSVDWHLSLSSEKLKSKSVCVLSHYWHFCSHFTRPLWAHHFIRYRIYHVVNMCSFFSLLLELFLFFFFLFVRLSTSIW